jgi:Raf kinase inhibitor-like YbhB/YbcL family protein
MLKPDRRSFDMKIPSLALCFLVLACSNNSDAVTEQDRHVLASARAETQVSATFSVTSSAFAAGGAVPLRHSAYGDGVSPALSWSGVPAGARSLALMMEDPDATSARPFVHWLAWNIDPASGGLAEGIPSNGSSVAGLRQGRTSRDSVGYFGPRPHGSSPHHYHFQLFALDTSLDLADGADREALLTAMNDHVIARGELVGLFGQPRD